MAPLTIALYGQSLAAADNHKGKLDSRSDSIRKLLATCNEIAAPYVHGRDELFSNVERQLVQIYRELMDYFINKELPLVIVDEAHHWKNGPSSGTNGYKDFVHLIGSRARRAILLTATPFQLRPAEMLEILKVGDHLRTCPTGAQSAVRRGRLIQHREHVIRPILNRAAHYSGTFGEAWSKVPLATSRKTIESAWSSAAVAETRSKLRVLGDRDAVVRSEDVENIIGAALCDVDPDIRQLLREGLRLFVYNCNLSNQLGFVVIRHRRHTEHRLFRVGSEYQVGEIDTRPDRHVLHAAPGIDVRGDGELPHYVLMRCVSEMKNGKGRSSLGNDLTGCYSTLIESSEGRAVKKRLAETDTGKIYLKLLMGMVNSRQDPKHPKVREVVEAALKNWQAGEKTLIFCFRTNTAKRLHDIIDDRIRKELNRRRVRCMGGPESLKALRTRLTGRERDLIVVGLDRVLWSVLWSKRFSTLWERAPVPDDLEITDDELPKLAEMGLRYGMDLTGERLDRVFLHRAFEQIVALRLLIELKPCGEVRTLLSQIGNEEWIRGPYGLSPNTGYDEKGAETAQFDEPGSPRFTLYNATRLRDQQFVALVSGSTDPESRERVFSGFNTPLLPEILICTAVGQEGIDLHRHCRHVVHFDLAWNPAVLEQRTGRVDRIGSKTFRERALSSGPLDSFLEIGVPYLAGTYDERMYEELRLRAQTFEVLTGGELSADDAEGYDDQNHPEGHDAGLRFVPLPSSMLESMRVNLHIWSETSGPGSGQQAVVATSAGKLDQDMVSQVAGVCLEGEDLHPVALAVN